MIEYSEIGVIPKVEGVYDDDGKELSAPIYYEGWFVNATTAPEAWEAMQIFPKTPYQLYSGAPTFFFNFGTQEAWLLAEAAIQ